MTKEWVTENCCVGFCTDKALMLDLDNVTFRNAKWIAEGLLNPHSLEDYLFLLAYASNFAIISSFMDVSKKEASNEFFARLYMSFLSSPNVFCAAK